MTTPHLAFTEVLKRFVCECGEPIADHSDSLILAGHDYSMRRASIERMRSRLRPSEFSSLTKYGWLLIDTVLTDEEVGR